MRALSLREIASAGLIAAVYAVLGLAFQPISFAVYQIRVAEALTVLPFLARAAIPGLFIGCMLANVFGGLGWQDIIFGSLITLAAAFLTRLARCLSRAMPSVLLSVLPVILFWAGALVLLNQDEIRWLVIVLIVVAVPPVVVAAWLRISRRSDWLGVGGLWFLSVVFLAAALYLSAGSSDSWVLVIGAVALTAAWLLTWMLAVVWFSGGNLNVIIAPLPPVLLNAFGVSLYLAPIMGVDYWFSVQMVGVGQLIACYLLGLPLLRLLEKRKWVFAWATPSESRDDPTAQ